MGRRGRPRKNPVVNTSNVVLSAEEFRVIATRLGFDARDLIDNLAMGLIPPVVGPEATPTAALEVESSGKLPETGIAKGDSEESIVKSVQKRLSWAEATEVEEARAAEDVVQKLLDEGPVNQGNDGIGAMDHNPKPVPVKNSPVKTWAEVAKGDSVEETLQPMHYMPADGMSVKLDKEDWEEGNHIWKHALIGQVAEFRPSFSDMQRWVERNWKKYNPRVSHVRPGVYLFEFKSEEEKSTVLGRRWTFYGKSEFPMKEWDIDMDVDNLSFDDPPI